MRNRVSTLVTGVGLICLSLGCTLTGDPDIPNRVVVYTSVDRIFSEPVLKEAEKRLGIKVVGVYDTEETKSTGLVNRLIAKRQNPDCDVFWSGDPARAAQLKAKGITAAYDSVSAERIPDSYKDPDRHWIGFSARTRVLLVNNDLVAVGEEPQSIFDLVDPRWKDNVAIANPLFGTTSFHVAALYEALGEDKAKAWLDDLRANGVKILTSNGEVKRQVSSGQVAVGLSDSDDASEAIADGQPIRAVVLDQIGTGDTALGTLVIPNTVSLIAHGPNPSGARKVIDFLLSADSLTMLANSCAQAPLVPGVPIPESVVALDGIVAMDVDYAATAERLNRIMTILKEWVEQ